MGASAVVTLIGIGVQAYSAKKQRAATRKGVKAQERAIATQQRAADLKAARDRVRSIREARIKRATLVARAEGAGVGGASGAQAGRQGVVQQLAGNLGFSQQVQGLGAQASAFNQQAAVAQGQAATWGAIGGIGQSIFSNSERIGGMFNTAPTASGTTV